MANARSHARHLLVALAALAAFGAALLAATVGAGAQTPGTMVPGAGPRSGGAMMPGMPEGVTPGTGMMNGPGPMAGGMPGTGTPPASMPGPLQEQMQEQMHGGAMQPGMGHTGMAGDLEQMAAQCVAMHGEGSELCATMLRQASVADIEPPGPPAAIFGLLVGGVALCAALGVVLVRPRH